MYSRDMRIAGFDDTLWTAITQEVQRQEQHIELIASENYASPRVLEAQGSVLTNKYAEGYPGKRYYGGCEFVDVAEQLAIDRQRIVRCRLCECPAPFRFPGQCRRVHGPAQPGGLYPGHEPGPWWAFNPRGQGEFFREII